MSSSSNNNNKKLTVVVVGGGSAGASIVRPLSKSLNPALHDLVLINSRPYTIPLPPALRLVSSSNNDIREKTFLPFDKLFLNGNGRFVLGEVVGMDTEKKELHLKDGKSVFYDILVLATGSKWEGPIGFPEDPSQVDAFIEQRRNEFATANDILLVGGGAVGIELAGELRDVYPKKKITIVHRDSLLLNSTYPEKARKLIQKQLEGRNIKVILGETAPEHTPGPQTDTSFTLNEQSLTPDLIVRTWGGRPNTQWLPLSFLTSEGFVKVKPTLQTIDYPDIFAAGDIIDWSEQKQAAKAGRGHAPVVVKNVLALANGQKVLDGKYEGSTEMIVVTNGKDAGVGYMGMLGGVTLGSFMSRNLKSKTLLVGAIRSGFGY